MSAAAEHVSASTIGNTARVLGGNAVPAERQRTKRRTPLSLVPAAPRRRRAPFVVFCFVTLVAALATVLVLNISVSSGQYQLVQLHAKQAELLKANQELTQQVQKNEAPQNLVNEAADLGMVTSTSVGQIDLKTMKVSGTPTPAPAGAKTKSLIAAPSVGGAPVTAATGPSTAVVPGGPAKAGSTDSSADAAPGASPANPAPPAVDLHGGTIPSPQQKNG